MEKEFDEIAEGKENWKSMMQSFFDDFEPLIEATMKQKSEHKIGERVLGTDPASGKPVSVKIGRFGPVVQIGSATDDDKPRFAQLGQGQSLQTITLEEALELFKLPRVLGTFEDTDVTVGTGRFGAYVQHAKKYVTIPKGIDPMSITLEEAIELIEIKRKSEAAAHLKTFEEDAELEVMNGRFWPYLKYKGANYKLSKLKDKEPQDLTYEECMGIINSQGESAPKRTFRRTKKS